MAEKTLIMIKPDHVQVAYRILDELDDYGTRGRCTRIDSVPLDVIARHYVVHQGKSFYDRLIDSFVGRAVVVAIYEGDDIVRKMLDKCGATDPLKAAADTIRKKYSTDSLEKAISEGRTVKNVIHRSDSVAEAHREIEVWKRYLG